MRSNMRAAIYARYSSENQREASIDDQVEVCRRHAAAAGWAVTQVYSDAAASGASRFRPGYQRLLADAGRRSFDVVLVEALDRLGRKLADVADLHDRLQFLGVRLVAVNVGEITALHVGLLGTMAQLQLSDLRDKTRRGQLGRVLAGRVAGGLAYGYAAVEADASGAGARRVVETEAAVVRRIFADFAAGLSPRAIAKALNAEGVPGPGGRPWIDTTIRGQADRGTGILNNALYAGRLEWNRCSYVKDPATGRRVARPNPVETWEVVRVPELRIVGDALWDRAKARQREVGCAIGQDGEGNALNRTHRRRFLLSGLLECGVCGGGYTIMAKDRYGCAAHRQKGTCANDRTVARAEIEGRVLVGLKERLLAPELVSAFVAEFTAETARLAEEARSAAAALERELAGVERGIAGLLRAIEDGMYAPSMKERMAELEGRRDGLRAELAAGASPPPPISLHPNLPELYRRRIERLEEALSGEDAAGAMETVRGMIERVVLVPRTSGRGLDALLHGDLAAILAACEAAGRKGKRPPAEAEGRQLSVVAGAGFEPATFRL